MGGREKGRVKNGISAASGLPELWIAVGNDGRLDYGCHSLDQQLLQEAGPQRYPIHGADTVDKPIANGTAELSPAVADWYGNNSYSEHRGPVRKAAARRDSGRAIVRYRLGVFDPRAMDFDRSELRGL